MGDGGVLGKGSTPSSQQCEKQKFFATRSPDGKWNLLMAPTSDPSRLFLVQPAPGHRFQVAGGGVRMESTSTASPGRSGESSSTSNGCVDEQGSGLSSPESGDLLPSTSTSIAVPIAQLRTPSVVSPPRSTHTTAATCTTDVGTTASAAEPVRMLSPHNQKKPSFFKSRTARDREALKASAQHLVGKKVLAVPRRGSAATSAALGGDGAEKGKRSKSAKASKSHGKSSKLPTSLQESMSQCFSLMSMSSVDTSSTATSAATTSTAATTSSLTCTDITTTVSISFTSATSTTNTSPSSPATSNTGMASSVDSRLQVSPSSSPSWHETSSLSPPSSVLSPWFVSRSRSDLSSVVGNVSDSAPVANFQMEGPSSRKADSVYLNKGCEHESNTSRHDELFTNASLGNSPANSKKSSLLRTIEGDDSKTGKESSGDTFDEDHIVPRQSTDYPEQSSGARVSSLQTVPDAPRIDESHHDDVDGNGHESTVEQRGRDEIDTDDPASHKESTPNRKKDADEDSSATEVSDMDDLHPRRSSYRPRRGAAADKTHIQLPCGTERQLVGKDQVKSTADGADSSMRRHSKRQKAMPKASCPDSASDTDDYDVIADAGKETRKASSKGVGEDCGNQEFVKLVETGKGIKICSSRVKTPNDSEDSDKEMESSQSYSVDQTGTEDDPSQLRKIRKDYADGTHDSVQSPVSEKNDKVDKDDDANEPELSPAFRSRSSGKSQSDFRATVECETGSQDRQRGLAGKTKHRVCQEAEAGRERHERSCRTGSVVEHSRIVSKQESASSAAESSEPIPLNTVQPGIITTGKQNKTKTRKKRKSELEALMENQQKEEESASVMEASENESAPASRKESAPASQKESVPASQNESAPASQEESELASLKESSPASQREVMPASQKESLLASQKDASPASLKESAPASQKESAPALQTELAPISDTVSAPAEDLVGEEQKKRKPSHQEPEPDKTLKSVSDSAEEEIVSSEKKQKKKKKKKLKLLISLGKAKSKDITDHAGAQSNALPISVTRSVPEDEGGSSGNEPKEAENTVAENLEDLSAGINKNQEANAAIFPGSSVHSPTKSFTKVGRPKKNKKNKKVKIIFSSGQESSRREIPDIVTSDSDSRKQSDIVLETHATDSLDTSQNSTDNDTPARDLTAKFGNGKPKKARKKRLTELETLIQDQETLSRPELSTVDALQERVLEEDEAGSTNGTNRTEPGSTKEAETSEVKGTEEPEISGPSKDVVDALRDTLKKRSKQQPNKGTLHSVSKKVDKPKKKKKMKKKMPTAGVITMPPLTSGTDTDATEPITDIDDIADSTQNAPDPGGCLPSDSAHPPQTRDANVAVSMDKDEEEDAETKAEKALSRFLKNRSFSEWELAGMFGTPFVVLERLSEKDIFFMSRRFRNARVSSRARCSAHCRMRTLGYLCELKLINCRPPPGFRSKRTPPEFLPDGVDRQPQDGEPPKKKKKKKDAEEKDGKERKRKKKKYQASGKANPLTTDDIILIGDGVRAPQVSQGPSNRCTATSAFSGFTSSSAGRIVRLAPVPSRPHLQPSSSQTTAVTGPRIITMASLPTGGASSLPQIITIPSLAATSSGPSRIIIPSLLAKAATPTTTVSSSSLRDATRASLAQAISKSLIKTGHVVPVSATSTTLAASSSANSVLISALSGSGLSKGPVVVPHVPVAPGLASTTQSSATVPRPFLVVQMGNKRVLVPATALTTTATAPSSASLITTTSCPGLPSVVTVGSGSAQRTSVTAPTVLTEKTASVRVSSPASVVPGTVARIVLANRRGSAPLAPRTGPTASSLLFANRPGVARPNQPWSGPRTVDSNKRVLVTPATIPQGIRVVLSGAGSISSGTHFTVASSRGGVFVASRPPTSLVRMAPPGQTRKRVMTEEERLRKRARLEKKYPLPPGVVIKTEPVTRGYGDEGKTVQASSTATRVYVSSVPVSRSQVNLNQPIPVVSAMRGGPIIIRQAAPGTSSQRSSSLLGPLIIRVPSCTATNTSSATTTRIAFPTTTSLLSSSARLTAPARTTAPMAISLLNTGTAVTTATISLATSALTSSASLVSSVRSSVSETSSAVSGTVFSVTSATNTSTMSADTSLESRSVGSANNTAQADDDDAIYIADSPPPETPAQEAEEPPRSQSVPSNIASSPLAAGATAAVVSTAALGISRTSPTPIVSVTSSSIPTFTSTVSSAAAATAATTTTTTSSTTTTSATAITTTSATTTTTTTSCSVPSPSTSAPASPVPSTSSFIPSSRLASLGAMWVRQAAESPGSIPSIDARSLQSERMRRLRETLAKQMESIGDERRQKALQALHQQFCLAASGGGDGASTREKTSGPTAAPSVPVSGNSDASSSGADRRPSESTIQIDLTEPDATEENVSHNDARGGSDSMTKMQCSDVDSGEAESAAQSECAVSSTDQIEKGMEISTESAEAEKSDKRTDESDRQVEAEDTSGTDDTGKPKGAATQGNDCTEQSSIETDGSKEGARETKTRDERTAETLESEDRDTECAEGTSGKGDGDAEGSAEAPGSEEGDANRAAETAGGEERELDGAAETIEREEEFTNHAAKASGSEEGGAERSREISGRGEGNAECAAESCGMEEGGDTEPVAEFPNREGGGAERAIESTGKDDGDCEAGNIDGVIVQEETDDVAETTAGHDLTGNKESGGRAVNAGEETVCETDNSGKTTGENDTGGMCVEIVSSDGEESENVNNQINDS